MEHDNLKRKERKINGRTSPFECKECNKVTPFDKYRFASTGIVFVKCSNCGKRRLERTF